MRKKGKVPCCHTAMGDYSLRLFSATEQQDASSQYTAQLQYQDAIMLLDLHRSLTFASRHVLSDAEAFSVLAMISYGLKRV